MSSTFVDESISDVFETVAHIDQYSKVMPHIVSFEYLTDQTRGVGTRFRETRQMGNREHTTELEVTEYEPSQRIRFVSHAGGTIWDSTFLLSDHGHKTEVAVTMDARAKNPFAALMNWMIKSMIQRGMDNDLGELQRHFASK